MAIEIQDPIDRIRTQIEEVVGSQQFKIWFRHSTQFSLSEDILKVGVPNLFIGGWIEDHFADSISDAAEQVMGLSLIHI